MSSMTRMFEGLLEAVPKAVVGVDQAGVIRFVNSQTELLFGYERDDLVGAPLETLVPRVAAARPQGEPGALLGGPVHPDDGP